MRENEFESKYGKSKVVEVGREGVAPQVEFEKIYETTKIMSHSSFWVTVLVRIKVGNGI